MGYIVFYNECAQLFEDGECMSSFLQFICTLATSKQCILRICQNQRLLVYACTHAKLIQSCDSLRPYGLQSTRLFCPWDSPGTNTGVGCHALLQAQASNPSLLHLLQLQTGSLPLAPPWKPYYLYIYLNLFIHIHLLSSIYPPIYIII